jgi:hypothetical protein
MPMYRGFLPRYMFAQHIPYMYHRYTIGSMKGRMVHVRKTYTVLQTLCTSGFPRGDGIWVYVCFNALGSPGDIPRLRETKAK